LTPSASNTHAAAFIDAYPPVLENPSLAPFTSSSYRASKHYFTTIDMAILVVLAASSQLLQNSTLQWQVSVKLAVSLTAVAASLYPVIVLRPFTAEHAWKEPVRVYSLLLAAMQAVLNFAMSSASLGTASSAGGASDQLPASVTALATCTFILACGLVAVIFGAFWVHLLTSGKRARVRNAALGRDAKTAASVRRQGAAPRLSTYRAAHQPTRVKPRVLALSSSRTSLDTDNDDPQPVDALPTALASPMTPTAPRSPVLIGARNDVGHVPALPVRFKRPTAEGNKLAASAASSVVRDRRQTTAFAATPMQLRRR